MDDKFLEQIEDFKPAVIDADKDTDFKLMPGWNYLYSQVRGLKPLTVEQELQLLRQYKSFGDKDARNALITHNIRFIKQYSNYYSYGLIDKDDAFIIGVCGYMSAIDCYDMSAGTRLNTFALFRIRREITRSIPSEKLASPISLPVHYQDFLYKLKRARQVLERRGEIASSEALAEEMGLSVAKVEKYIKLNPAFIYIDAPISEESDTDSSFNIPSPDKSPEDELIDKMRSEEIKKMVGSLSKEHRYIIEHYYGLFNNKKMTYAEMERDLASKGRHITRHYIGDEHKVALKKLRGARSNAVRKLLHDDTPVPKKDCKKSGEMVNLSEEQFMEFVLKEIEDFSEKERIAICSYFGYNELKLRYGFDDIALKLNMDSIKAQKLVFKSLDKLEKRSEVIRLYLNGSDDD